MKHIITLFGAIFLLSSSISMVSWAEVDVITTDKYGSTPLHRVIQDGDLKASRKLFQMERLLENGADIHARDVMFRTPLSMVFENDNVEAVQLFIDNGFDINATKAGKSIIYRSLVKGKREMSKMLIENGANVNVRNVLGYTPLHALAWSKAKYATDMVKMLIERGADINATDYKGNTPLHFSAWYGEKSEIAEILIENGADIHAKNINGTTPLEVALKSAKSKDVARVFAIESMATE